MQRSKIEWCEFTSNPIRGKCRHACPYCYAEQIRLRFKQPEEISWHPEELTQIEKRKKPSTIFMGSMHDIFGEWVNGDWISWILDTAKNCPQHTFLFLTKNPKRYSDFDFPDNCWRGTTVIKDTDFYLTGEKTFISLEPLINPTDFKTIHTQGIIIGAMTGRNAIIPLKEWVLNLIKQAQKDKCKIFIKDNLLKIYPDLPKLRDKPF